MFEPSLRVGDIRVFYDVTESQVQVLAIVTKAEAQSWLDHTFTAANASTRVLAKCGFHAVGEVIDPDDGLVWRWERRHD